MAVSFSRMVKEEAAEQIPHALHCQIAESAAIFGLIGSIETAKDGTKKIKIETENDFVEKKCFTLFRKAFSIESGAGETVPAGDVSKISDAFRLQNGHKGIADDVLIRSECCKRAFIRGAFLAAGSLSDPHKAYHLEFVCNTRGQAEQLIGVIAAFGIEAHFVERKKASGRLAYVVYIKEGDGISDLLNMMKAHVALMAFEDARIRKDIANSINRQVNCETANIKKTITASSSQVEDILYLQERVGLENLPEGLRDLARLRLENRDTSLKELGEMLDPPVGKSGVNHRLRKIKQLADALRESSN
ncbi:MAG: DNA-binding protein WhiA [Lachnospiraceae bacterium]|nr:DNA-binding protein WhiA [Lachnospiraceae bacterium]